MLLIIDNKKNIDKYFTCENRFLDASDLTLFEVLEKLQLSKDIKKIYFPLELKFKNKYRQHFEGLELLKHIRLTTELGKEIQFAPILLGYTYPLETVLRNPESTILSAPATYLYNLKNIYQINSSKFFQCDETLTKDKLKPYILYTDTDEAKSEHDRRNDYGPLKLKDELSGARKSNIDLELWQKKVLFLQKEKTHKPEATVCEQEFSTTIKGKRILYLDDEANKWGNVLKQLFEGAAHFEVQQNLSEIRNFLTEKKEYIETVLSQFSKRENLLYTFRNNIDATQFSLSQQPLRNTVENEVNTADSSSKFKETLDNLNTSLKYYTNDIKLLGENSSKFDENRFYKNTNFLATRIKEMRMAVTTSNKNSHSSIANEELHLKSVKKVSDTFLNQLSIYPNRFTKRLLEVFNYDLILLDLRLSPEADGGAELPSGIEILKLIKSINPYIPVILFTASQNMINKNEAERHNSDGAYWIKNISTANDLKNNILNIIKKRKLYELYWKSQLILVRNYLEKYNITNNGTSIERVRVNSNDLTVIKESLSHFLKFIIDDGKCIIDEFWKNTFKLSEARFASTSKNRLDRPELINILQLGSIENTFNIARIKAAHITKQQHSEKETEYNLCREYIDYSIEWLLSYLPLKT